MKSLLFACLVLLFCSAGLMGAAEQYVVEVRRPDVRVSLPGITASTPLLARSVVDAKVADRVLSATQRTTFERLTRFRTVVVERPEDLEQLRAHPDVLAVYANHRFRLHDDAITSDSLSNEQYALRIVRAAEAWKIATGKGVLVGVVDTGIDWFHPDLKGALAVNAAEDLNRNGTFEPWPADQTVDGVSGDINGADDDGNGYIDDVIGYDLVDQSVRNIGDDRDRDPVPFDEHGHGTSVAGVIAATPNNGIGIAGLAYGSRIITARAFDATGNAEEDDIAAGVIYAVLRGARVINMSFGDGVDAPVLRAAVDFAHSMGCVLIASSGNTGGLSRQFPASYDNVVAIGATNRTDGKSPFSSTGSMVHMSAPGDGIVTTAAGGRYRTVSGTSFSAPYVAAAAAMLLEIHPALTPNEAVSMLAEHSVDLGDHGWDGLFGAGRLDVRAVLSAVAASELSLSVPMNESEIDAGKQSRLDVSGTATSILFDHYEVYVGTGAEPVSWNLIGGGNQTKDAVLASWNLDTVTPGEYVVRAVVVLKNTRTLEERRRIRVIRNAPLQFATAKLEQAWQDDRRTAILTVRSTRLTTLLAHIYLPDMDTAMVLADFRHKSRTHSVVLGMLQPGVRAVVTAVCTADNGGTVEWRDTITIDSAAAPVLGWTEVAGKLPPSYVLNATANLYSPTEPTIVVNDITSGSFGSLRALQREGDVFVPKDSLTSVWIPRGIGDVNGDGREDILCHVVNKAILFTSDGGSPNPFAKVLWADTLSGRWNAAGLGDVNGDGRPDIVMLSDSGALAVGYVDGSFRRLGLAQNTTQPLPGADANRIDEVSVAIGDFDSDGNVEIAFGDTDGDIVIAEYANGVFHEEYRDTSDGIGGSGYITAIDIDGDGRKEVAYAVPDDIQPNSERDYGRQAWTVKIARADGPNTYRTAWQDRFAGVRYGIGYRSGIGSGALDTKAGDELVLCVFPRLYVFSWDVAARTMRPTWYKPDVVTPRFLIHDFDNNGIQELGIGTTEAGQGYMSAFSFYQADTSSGIKPPAGVRAQFISPDFVRVSWAAAQGVHSYVIYRATSDDPSYREYARTSATHIVTEAMPANVAWAFRVATAAQDTTRLSARSAEVVVVSRPTGALLSIIPSVVDSLAVSQGLVVRLRFTSILAERDLQDITVRLAYASGADTLVATSVVLGSDSTLVVGFPSAVRKAGNYALFVDGARDLQGKPLLPGAGTIAVVAGTRADEVLLSRLRADGARSITLWFDRAVTSATAGLVSSYVLAPHVAIERVEADGSDSVRIIFGTNPAPGALGFSYAITAVGVFGTDGVAITKGAGNTLGFVIAESTLDHVGVYPHPVHLGQHENVTFSGLTAEAVVDVLDQRMVVIATIREADGNGGVQWNLQDSTGKRVPPGLYFYRVSGAGANASVEESGLGKLMIMR